jgi:uncharacterized protein (TIGR00725 family)
LGSPAYKTAYQVSRTLAQNGFAIICGGQSGVMEAACKGAQDGGGLGIALLPTLDAALSNSYAGLVLPTDLGRAQDPIVNKPRDVSRNRVIASSASCLVAVSGGVGTANEIKHALAFGKVIFGLCDAPDPEAIPVDNTGSYSREADVGTIVEKVLKLTAGSV